MIPAECTEGKAHSSCAVTWNREHVWPKSKAFPRREQWAHGLGYRANCFCAVERAEPPAGYRPLHDFWRKRGYVYHPELRCQMSWQDVGESVPTPKPLSFWLRES